MSKPFFVFDEVGVGLEAVAAVLDEVVNDGDAAFMRCSEQRPDAIHARRSASCRRGRRPWLAGVATSGSAGFELSTCGWTVKRLDVDAGGVAKRRISLMFPTCAASGVTPLAMRVRRAGDAVTVRVYLAAAVRTKSAAFQS